MEQLDLLSYPQTPGHRGVSTSISAAKKMHVPAQFWQRRVLQHIIDAGSDGLTNDELYIIMDAEPKHIQPRTSSM